MRISFTCVVLFTCCLLSNAAHAQSNPYVLLEDWSGPTVGAWDLQHAHVTAAGECGSPAEVMAFNDGSGMCTIGGIDYNESYWAGSPSYTFHPTQEMQLLYSFRNTTTSTSAPDVHIWSYRANNSTCTGYCEFTIDSLNSMSFNDGLWWKRSQPVPVTLDMLGDGIPGANMVLAFDAGNDTGGSAFAGGWFFDDIILRPRGNGNVFCHGFGCPCGNDSDSVGTGCKNSTGKSAWLHGYGDTSLASDEIEFVAAEIPVGQPALLFQGTTQTGGASGIPFGDGLRCVGGFVQRMGVKVASAQTTATWTHMISQAGWTAGQTALLQVYYRDPAGSPCGSAFNTTNGYTLTLVP